MRKSRGDLGLRSERIAEQEDSVSQSAMEKPQDRRSHLGK